MMDQRKKLLPPVTTDIYNHFNHASNVEIHGLGEQLNLNRHTLVD